MVEEVRQNLTGVFLVRKAVDNRDAGSLCQSDNIGVMVRACHNAVDQPTEDPGGTDTLLQASPRPISDFEM